MRQSHFEPFGPPRLHSKSDPRRNEYTFHHYNIVDEFPNTISHDIKYHISYQKVNEIRKQKQQQTKIPFLGSPATRHCENHNLPSLLKWIHRFARVLSTNTNHHSINKNKFSRKIIIPIVFHCTFMSVIIHECICFGFPSWIYRPNDEMMKKKMVKMLSN